MLVWVMYLGASLYPFRGFQPAAARATPAAGGAARGSKSLTATGAGRAICQDLWQGMIGGKTYFFEG